jgi:hypothetical protein
MLSLSRGSNLGSRRLAWRVLLLGLMLSSSRVAHGSQWKDEDYENFEDQLLVLTKLSENLTVDFLSLKSFQCREKLLLTEEQAGSSASKQLEWEHSYQVVRQPRKRAISEATFIETRKWQGDTSPGAPVPTQDYPFFDNPFTGYISQMFSLDNRLSSDFKSSREEKILGRDCVVLDFDTVQEITRRKISILNSEVPLRQRGLLWVTKDDYRLMRLKAKQVKLPKGCRSYEYQIDFAPQSLAGRFVYLPFSLQLTIVLKDRSYRINQNYTQFEATP